MVIRTRQIGLILLTALIISLIPITVKASDSLNTIRDVMTKSYMLLAVDTNGTDLLDTATVRRLAYDGAIRAYTDLGDAKTKKIAIVAKTSGYEIDFGLISIDGVILDSNQTFHAMQRIDPSRLDDLSYYNNLTGTFVRPRYYIRHGDSLNIYPRPVLGDTMTVFYHVRGKFPGARGDTVAVTLPSEYRTAAVYATMSMCELRRKNDARVSFIEQLYAQEVARLRGRFELEGNNKDMQK